MIEIRYYKEYKWSSEVLQYRTQTLFGGWSKWKNVPTYVEKLNKNGS